MRKKYAAIVVCAAAIVSAASVSVTGQQEPLPVVTPKQSAEIALEATPETTPAVYLASDPIRESHQPTLEEAARNNDYVTFDALYRAARQRGDDVSHFATLHELWTWAISDPVGAFYGRETYTKLARAYPGYAAYIADFAITDSNGNTFWPTSETRIFLISRAGAGEAPRTELAEAVAPTVRRESTLRRVTKTTAATTRTQADAPTVKTTAPIVKTTAPSVNAITPSVKATAPATRTTAPIAEPVAPAVTEAAPVTSAPVTSLPVAAPIVAPSSDTTPAVTRRDGSLMNRGILLLVLGLIGVGLLAVIFRTPKDDDDAQTMARANVEPIRKAEARQAAEDERPRATGSHG